MKEEREAHLRWEQEFYAKCSELLNVKHKYYKPVPRRTRWNTRLIGNGRYPGFGVIRIFSKTNIYVMSHKGCQTYTNEEEVYAVLKGSRNTLLA